MCSIFKMTDYLTPSPRDYTDTIFQFNSTSKLSLESGSKLSAESPSPISPLSLLKENRYGSSTLPNGVARLKNTNMNNNNNNNSINVAGSAAHHNSTSSQRSSHSSGDSSLSSSSGASSANSVFYKAKTTSVSSAGNEYVREPLKVVSNGGVGSYTGANRLYPSGTNRNVDSSCTSLKSKLVSEEVTYTINDEMDDSSNQVVFLPPPPTDIDSDNDSVGGCDVGGACSPRHHDWRSSRDLSKSPTSRGINHGNSKCLCCMLLVFVLSTAGLTAVLVLMYLGKLQLAPLPTVHSYNEEGRPRLGEGALIREVCETTSCLKTSSSILNRMNITANPCEDFYNYACGGYIKETDLSWFRSRIRETPDEIMQEHRKLIIDRLSTSFDRSDDRLLATSKEIFRSCLLRPGSGEDGTKTLVTDLLDLLGGLVAPTEASNLTQLLGNVTRMFGASPFFKVVVHSDKNLSLVSKVTDYVNPLTSPPDYSRSRTSTKQNDANANQARLNDLLLHLIRPTVNESEARSIVTEFFRLEDNIRRILNTGQEHLDSGDGIVERPIVCDSPSSQKNLGEMQVKYNVFGIDWFSFFQNVLDTPDVSDIKFCKVKLSNELQHLLKITPKTVLRQFIILHTLIHSDLFILVSKNYQNVIQTSDGRDLSQTLEERCLDLIVHFLPTLEKYIGCDGDTLTAHRSKTFGVLRNIRTSLYNVLTNAMKLLKDNAAVVTNSSMKPVMDSLNEELVSRCQTSAGPQGSFDEYSFNSNMLRIIQYYHGEYFRGRLTKASRDLELTALWIASSVPGHHRSRAGPIVYSSPVPLPIMYGSLGSFLATRVAERLGIEDLLDHHSEGLLNHSIVLGLAVKLKCLVEMYKKMDILDFGSQVYKVDGEKTKDQQWKDQLTLKLSYKAWQEMDRDLEADHFIPGLSFTRPQMFFIAFAQTQCEKVSERGILQYYVNDGANPAIPGKQRVNGMLRTSDDFAEAFQCSDNMYMNPMDKCRVFG